MAVAGTVTSAGIGSGLDVNSIVTKLMAVEQQPVTLLNQQEASYQASLSSLGLVKGTLSALQTAAQALSGVNTATFSATSTDTTKLTASTSSDTSAGSYSVDVTHLAKAQRLIAAGQTTTTSAIGGGTTTTITASFGAVSGGTFDAVSGTYSSASFARSGPAFTITIDSGNNTLEKIRDAINAANGGVKATIVNDGSSGGAQNRLVLSVNNSGAANSLKIEVSGDAAVASLLANDPAGTQKLSQTQAAQDAMVSIDGVTISRPTNTISDAIAGVTLVLAATTTDSPVTVTVAHDFSSAQSQLQTLVKAYNDFKGALNTATGKGAILQGNSTLLRIQQHLGSLLGGIYGSTSVYNNLSSLGVSFQRDGTLTFDSSKLTAALSKDSAGALATLASAADAVGSFTDSAVKGQGLIDTATSGINSSIKSVSDKRDALVARMAIVEQRYRAQFTALDVLLGNMNQTSAFLTAQLSASTVK